MNFLSRALLLLLVLCGWSTACAQDSAARLRAVMNQVHAGTVPPDEMIVEGCVTGASLAPAPGQIVVTVHNALATDGLVIEYIRKWEWNTRARDERFLLQGGVPIVEGPTTLVSEALVQARWGGGDHVASVLRPGERCQMWLPAGNWQVITSRVPITASGHRLVVQDQCLNLGTWETVPCKIRLDTVGYGTLGEWSGRLASRTGDKFDFDSGANWQPWKK